MDGIVNADSQNNRRHEHRKRVQLAVEQRRKRKRREACVKHGTGHENRAFHAPEEERRQEEDEYKADAERENTVVSDFVHLFQSFIGSFNGKAGGHRVVLAAEIFQEVVGLRQNFRNKFIVGRGLDQLCVHDRVKENFTRAIGFRATNQAVPQAIRQICFRIPFLLSVNGIDRSIFFKERIERAHGFFGEPKFHRQIGIEPDTFLFRRFFAVCRVRRIAGIVPQQVDDERAIFAANFKLQIFQIIANFFEMLDREV